MTSFILPEIDWFEVEWSAELLLNQFSQTHYGELSELGFREGAD